MAYTPTNWQTGDTITAAKMNNIEKGVDYASNKGADLTIRFASEISNYTSPWAWIKARITAGNYYGINVSDYIPFTLTISGTPYEVKAEIIGVNVYTRMCSPAVGNHIDFMLDKVWYPVKLNLVDFNQGLKLSDDTVLKIPYRASNLYYFLNSLSGEVANDTTATPVLKTVDYTEGGIYYYLPSELKAVLADKYSYMGRRYSEGELLTEDSGADFCNMGKVWVPSVAEMVAYPRQVSEYYTDCFVQYPYFRDGANRIKKRMHDNVDQSYLLSGPAKGRSDVWVRINSSGTIAIGYTKANTATPICFRIEAT